MPEPVTGGLLTEIADALGSDHESIERDFGCYVVNDLVDCDLPKTILLLESPHVNEVCAGHPLAGDTGKNVTEALKRNPSIETMLGQIECTNQDSNANEAIGCILRRCPGTLRLGLMNACRLPLELNAYTDPQARNKWYRWQELRNEFLCLILRTVKSLPILLSDEVENHAFGVYRVLLDDLKSRLERLPADALVVPCGDVAKAFMEEAIGLAEYQGAAEIWDQKKVPHPARGQWKDQENAENIEVVKSLVNIIHERSCADA